MIRKSPLSILSKANRSALRMKPTFLRNDTRTAIMHNSIQNCHATKNWCRHISSTSVNKMDSAIEMYNVLEESSQPISVESVSERGFTLAEGLVVPGPCIFLNGTVFLWDVISPKQDDLSWEGWTIDHFKIFESVHPRPEILLVGSGNSTLPLAPHLRKYLNGLGIQVDTQSTRYACSAYNLLCEEEREVAAALLPLTPNVRWTRMTE